MSLDITKPVRTKRGEKVTELHRIGDYLVGVMDRHIHVWDFQGCCRCPESNLENVPEPRYVWLNVYKDKDKEIQTRCVFHSLEEAREVGVQSGKEHILRLDLDSLSVVKEAA